MREGAGDRVNTQQISAELAAMAATSGVEACALVDAATGMVYMAAGSQPRIDAIAEAASDYWRMYQRNGTPCSELGSLQVISMIHQSGVLSLIPCSKGILMVALSGRMKLELATWYQKVGALGRMIENG